MLVVATKEGEFMKLLICEPMSDGPYQTVRTCVAALKLVGLAPAVIA